MKRPIRNATQRATQTAGHYAETAANLDAARLLQAKEYKRGDHAQTHKANVRIITATNRDLKAAMEIIQTYQWPGNFRELRNTIELTTILYLGNLITPDDLLWGSSDDFRSLYCRN